MIGKAKRHSRAERTHRITVTENHGRQTDKSTPGGHHLIEASYGTEDEVRARETSHHATQHHGEITCAVDIDAERIGGFGMFADGPGAQPPAGV